MYRRNVECKWLALHSLFLRIPRSVHGSTNSFEKQTKIAVGHDRIKWNHGINEGYARVASSPVIFITKEKWRGRVVRLTDRPDVSYAGVQVSRGFPIADHLIDEVHALCGLYGHRCLCEPVGQLR